MRRTKFGLTLTYRNGEWVTPDGMLAIGRVRATEFCEGAHPERFRDVRTGRIVTGYCDGDREHDREVGWDIREGTFSTPPKGMSDDLYPTLTEAWETLAKHLDRTSAEPERCMRCRGFGHYRPDGAGRLRCDNCYRPRPKLVEKSAPKH